jgi:hypothetical protein
MTNARKVRTENRNTTMGILQQNAKNYDTMETGNT